MLKKFATSYNSGQLNELTCSLVPFLQKHLTEFKQFIDNFNEKNEKQSLDTLIKYFLISMNMPINFKFYLNNQSKIMESEIGPEIKNPDKRTTLVSNWIGKNAQEYREYSIMEQIYCFERSKDQILPQVVKLLEECA